MCKTQIVKSSDIAKLLPLFSPLSPSTVTEHNLQLIREVLRVNILETSANHLGSYSHRLKIDAIHVSCLFSLPSCATVDASEEEVGEDTELRKVVRNACRRACQG